MVLSLILLTTFLISLVAWVGIATVFVNDGLLDQISLVLVALAAGGLIGGAFLHLLPQTIQEYGPGDTTPLFLYVIFGFCLFYVLEQFISWHHHHGATHEHEPVTYLVLISDLIHNLIDGLVVAGAFLLGPDVGFVTAMAIALHEIPQEIGDFGILVYGGFSRTQALVLNYLTQSTVILGGVVGFYLSGVVGNISVVLLPFAAGNFIYIASSDLIPEIKESESSKMAAVYFGVFLTGILLMLGVKLVRSLLG